MPHALGHARPTATERYQIRRAQPPFVMRDRSDLHSVHDATEGLVWSADLLPRPSFLPCPGAADRDRPVAALRTSPQAAGAPRLVSRPRVDRLDRHPQWTLGQPPRCVDGAKIYCRLAARGGRAFSAASVPVRSRSRQLVMLNRPLQRLNVVGGDPVTPRKQAGNEGQPQDCCYSPRSIATLAMGHGMWGSGQVWPVALSTIAALLTRTVNGKTSAIALTTVASWAPWARVATETCGTQWPAS